MVHDFHVELLTFDPAQILHDGCAECEERSRSRSHGIANLDPANFARAWRRAALRNVGALYSRVSQAERPMLDVLWAVQVQLEKKGLRIGYLPNDPLGLKRS